MLIDYKDPEIVEETNIHGIEKSEQCISIDNATALHDMLIRISSSGEQPNNDFLIELLNYCKNSATDEIGVYHYLFMLSFKNEDSEIGYKVANELITMCQLDSFHAVDFFDIDNINILINHILTRDSLYKPAFIFLQQLLYRSEHRQILKNTDFFEIFESLSSEETKEIIYSFFSHAEDIDSSLFESMSELVYQSIEIERDEHKAYRFLSMLLKLFESDLYIDTIDLIIENFLDTKKSFMIEIITYLIQYSKESAKYFDYLSNNLYQYASIQAIFNASLFVLSKSWNDYSSEQKTMISSIISEVHPTLSFSQRYHLVEFLCDTQDWTVFNSPCYFIEMFHFINQDDLSIQILNTLFAFLSNDAFDDGFKFQCISLFPNYLEEFDELVSSPKNEINEIAQLFVDIIKEVESHYK